MEYDFSLPKNGDVIAIKNKMIELQNEYSSIQNMVNQLNNMVSYIEYHMDVMINEINIELVKQKRTAEDGTKLTKEELKSILFFSYKKEIKLPKNIKEYPVSKEFEERTVNMSDIKYIYLLFDNKRCAAKSLMMELLSAIDVCKTYPSRLY